MFHCYRATGFLPPTAKCMLTYTGGHRLFPSLNDELIVRCINTARSKMSIPKKCTVVDLDQLMNATNKQVVARIILFAKFNESCSRCFLEQGHIEMMPFEGFGVRSKDISFGFVCLC